ncbi:MAG: hypothetical protein COZ50_04070 [Zetaproteobacteria bacterium CG_4_10_14_3_um_filter_54_28]|nr:MAG: hypothetical protein COZ50_04070 [Zetaproteobacteria bacterium CG_4_10_14_3_um_filter_54_28]
MNGIQPNLSLVYNSQGGNGLLGMGWGLSGLSTIHRCARTVAQDGVKGGINLDANDRFCLDGQRLVATAGTYGATATEYRTEIESFSRITSAGTAGTGPASFTVETKDGKIMEYGVTADSRIEAQGKTTVLNWALNKISDRFGNSVTFTYIEDNAAGHFHIGRIDYAGNSVMGTAPKASVRFIYEARTDNAPVYVAGSKVTTPVRMANIKTYITNATADVMVRDYRLAYEYGTATTKRSRLLSSTEYDSTGTPKPAVTFNWQTGNNNPVLPAYASPALPATISGYLAYHTGGAQYMTVADFNGDGKSDYMWIPGNSDGRWLVAYSTGDGFTLPNYNAPALPANIGGYLTHHSSAQYMTFADFNGDGKTDYMWIPGNSDGRWLIAYSTGTGFTLPSYNAPALPANIGGYLPYHYSAQYMRFADFNGDGKTDYMWIPNNTQRWLVAYSTGTGFTLPNYNAPAIPDRIEGYYPYHQTMPHLMQLGDFNGDGKTDYMWVPGNGDGRWLVAYSTGDGFTLPSYNTPAIPANVSGHLNYHSGAQYMRFADFNGDGKTDYMWIPGNSDGRTLVAYSASNSDVIASVTNGSGATTTLTYKPLTDSTVYTKDTGAVDPERDIQAPIYVVSQASTDNGIGGQRITTYQYGGMKVDMSGRGNLGFAWMESTDTATGITSHTAYNQTYPYVGSALFSEQKLANGTLISRSENAMAQMSLNNGATLFPYVSQSIKKSYEINDGTNNPVVTVTTDTVYDTFGNATQITETKSDGSTRVVNNAYTNDTASWLLGRLTQASVTSTLPGQPAQTRTSGFAYNTQGLIRQEVVEPNNAALKLTTDYTYDGFGNRTSATVSAVGEIPRTTSTSYDPQGQFPLSSTNAMGHSESYLWDARFGVKTSLTGPNGLTTTWSYDGFGRKIGEQRADGTSTTITHHMDVVPFYVSSQSTGAGLRKLSIMICWVAKPARRQSASMAKLFMPIPSIMRWVRCCANPGRTFLPVQRRGPASLTMTLVVPPPGPRRTAVSPRHPMTD